MVHQLKLWLFLSLSLAVTVLAVQVDILDDNTVQCVLACKSLPQIYSNSTIKIYNINPDDAEKYKKNIEHYLRLEPAPDLYIWQGGEKLNGLIRKGLLRNLTSLWQQQDFYRLISPFAQVLTADKRTGYQYAVPYLVSPWFLLYYTKLFKDLGVDVPPMPSDNRIQTWSEFLAMCEKIKARGVVPLIVGGQDTIWHAMFLYDYMNMRINGPQFRDQLMAGNASWTTGEARRVFDEWRVLEEKGYLYSEWSNINAYQAKDIWASKKAAIVFGFPHPFFASPEEFRDNVASWFQFPKMNHAKIGESVATHLIMVAANSLQKNIKATSEVVSWFGSKACQDAQQEAPNYLPTNSLSQADKLKSPLYNHTRYRDSELMLSRADSLMQAFDIDSDPNFANPALELFLEWGKKRLTTDEVLKKLDQLRLEVYVGAVTAPTSFPSAGVFTAPFFVNLTAPTKGSAIYYTLDGSVPSIDSELYIGPILISSPGRTLLRAFASKLGMIPSSRLEVAFTIDLSGNKPIETLKSSTIIISQVFAALGLALIAVLSILTRKYQQTAVFRSSTPLFMLLMLFGTALVISSVFTMTQDVSSSMMSESAGSAVCMLQAWLLGVGFVLTMSCLVLKTWRISRIFNNSSLSVLQIPNTELMMKVGVFLGVEILINAVWHIYDPLKPTLVDLDANSRAWACRSTHFFSFLGVSVGWKALILISATYLAIKTRNVPSVFNESKQIGFAIYNVAFLASVTLPLSYVVNLVASHALRMIGILMCSIASMFIFLGPKVYVAIFCPEMNQAVATTKANNSVATGVPMSTVSVLSNKGQLNEDQIGKIASLLKNAMHEFTEAEQSQKWNSANEVWRNFLESSSDIVKTTNSV